MKTFLVLYGNKQSGIITEPLLKTHIEHLKNLRERGHLPMCGPFLDNEGGVLIFRADSKEEVESFMWEDPFIQEKYYQRFIIHEFLEANDENEWLAPKNEVEL